MLYECSCGWTASAATDFYKHLAQSKDSGASHQLVQARFTDKGGAKRPPTAARPATSSSSWIDDALAPAAAQAAASHAAAPTSWVDEYLLVDPLAPSSTAPAPAPQSRHLPRPPNRPPTSLTAMAAATGSASAAGLSASAAAATGPNAAPLRPGVNSLFDDEPLQLSRSVPRSGSASGRAGEAGLAPEHVVDPLAGALGALGAAPEVAAVLEPEAPKASTPRSWARGRIGSRSRGGAPKPPPEQHSRPSEDDIVDPDNIRLMDDGGPTSSGRQRGPLTKSPSTASKRSKAMRKSTAIMSTMMASMTSWRWFGTPDKAGAAAGAAGPTGAAEAVAVEEAVAAAGDAGPDGEVEAEALPVSYAHREAWRGVQGPDAYQPSEGLPAAAGAGPHAPGPSSPAAALGAVRDVEAILTWQNPWRTGRIFGLGLYLAICVRQMAKGHDLLQPSTALLAACFLLLLRNLLRFAVAGFRRAQQQRKQQQHLPGAGDGALGGLAAAAGAALGVGPEGEMQGEAEGVEDEQAAAAEAQLALQQRVERMLQVWALGAARYGAALVVLGSGLLSGRQAITSALMAALLWLGMVLGELRIMSQPTFWLLVYGAAFTIPAVYCRSQHAMDAAVDGALRFVARVLVSGSRTSLLSAAAVGGVLVAALPINFVLRASLAGACAFVVLLWQAGARHAGQEEGAGGVRASVQGVSHVRME